MLVGSLATGLAACGGFCAGSSVMVEHQVSAPICSWVASTEAFSLAH